MSCKLHTSVERGADFHKKYLLIFSQNGGIRRENDLGGIYNNKDEINNTNIKCNDLKEILL